MIYAAYYRANTPRGFGLALVTKPEFVAYFATASEQLAEQLADEIISENIPIEWVTQDLHRAITEYNLKNFGTVTQPPKETEVAVDVNSNLELLLEIFSAVSALDRVGWLDQDEHNALIRIAR